MEMRKCPMGHYYDASVHQACPYCQAPQGGYGNQGSYQGGYAQPGPGPSPTMPVGAQGDISKTMPLMNEQTGTTDTGKTVAMFETSEGVSPVTGWLVKTNGKSKGKDYRIHADHNYIGRGRKNDIVIDDDETISREKHAVLSYDDRERAFYLANGEGKSMVRVNGKALLEPVTLSAGDRVQIGKSEFIFQPFCGKGFTWEEN